jgi:hypothetical protein
METPAVVDKPNLPVEEQTELTDEQVYGFFAKTDWGKEMDPKKFMAKQQLGRVLTLKIVGRMFMVDGMETLEKLKAAMETSQQMADSAVEEEVKVRALGGVALASNAYTKLLKEVMGIVEKCDDKKKSTAQKPQMPNFYLQVNVDQTKDAKTGKVVEVKPIPAK